MGLKPVKDTIQTHSIDEDLRLALWNILCLKVWQDTSFDWPVGPEIDPLYHQLWNRHLKQPFDMFPAQSNKEVLNTFRENFFKCLWNEVYEFVEIVIQYFSGSNKKYHEFVKLINSTLQNELSGYRVVNGLFIEMIDENEIVEIEESLKLREPFATVKFYLQTAISLLADRKNPDYRDSTKKSIVQLRHWVL